MENIHTLYNMTNWQPQDNIEDKNKGNENPWLKILILAGVALGVAILTIVKWPSMQKAAICLIETSTPVEAKEYEFVSQEWLARYGLNLRQTSEDLNLDHDNDGLNVFSEYINMTDPLNADTDNDGYLDGIEVKYDYNPLGIGRKDSDLDGLPDYWEKANHLDVVNNDIYADPDKDSLPNQAEYFYLTDPQNIDTDGDGFTDYVEIMNGSDPSGAGHPETLISIEKIGVEAPIIWSESTNESEIQKDLQKGVVRYPDSDTDGVPGRPGNLFITGHSSDYLWKPGNYKYIFSKLNNLEPGDKVRISSIQSNGRQIDYDYEIYTKEVVEADDARLFLKTDEPILTLVTCWPLYTNQKRLMLKAKLVNK